MHLHGVPLTGAALAIAGCVARGPSTPAPLPTSFDVHVAGWSDRAPLVLEALSDWTAATGVAFRPVVTSDPCGGGACFAVSLDPRPNVGAACEDVAAAGCYQAALALAEVSSNFDDAWTLVILRHEIGHALGLGHIKDVAAVMFPELGQGAMIIGPPDVAAYEALR